MKMKIILFVFFTSVLAYLIIFVNSSGEGESSRTEEEIEKHITVNKINDKTIVVSFGADAVTAFNTKKGIVVIDAGISNSLTKKFRRVIEREFENGRFYCLINTHSHPDHTGGNQVFNDLPIIGHENCIGEMKRILSDTARAKANLLKIADEYETELNQLAEGSKDRDDAFTQMMRYKLAYNDLSGNGVPVYPSITFDDTLSLYCGNLTFNMIYFGRAHSKSDIIIHIPELKILITGDLFYYGSRPSFGEYGEKDIGRWRFVKAWYTEKLGQIETLIGGHGQIMEKGELLGLSEFIEKQKGRINE